MFIKIMLLFLSLNFITCAAESPDQSNIIIRRALESDLPVLLDFDRRVSFEYFKPLYSEGFSHLPLGKNPDYFLNLELEYDKEWLPTCIGNDATDLLFVAEDTKLNAVAGLLIMHQKNSSSLFLDLLLIGKEYRRMGIGKNLIFTAFTYFPDIKHCIVTPLQFANVDTLRFYQSIGFKDFGPSTSHHLNAYGIPYYDMYFYYQLDLTGNGIYYPEDIRSRTLARRHGIR